MGFELQAQPGRGASADFLRLKLLGKLPGGAAAQTCDQAEEVRPVGARNHQRQTLDSLANPGVAGAGFEFRERILVENDAEIEEGCLLDWNDFLAIHQVERGFDPLFRLNLRTQTNSPFAG